MQTLSIAGAQREGRGKKAAKLLRREGKVPCVLYGSGKNTHFSVEDHTLRDLIYTPDFKMVELDIDGTKTNCILKNVQFHPVSDEVEHVDFLSLSEGKKVKVEVPVRFTGNAPGLRSGGKLIQKLRRVKIKTTPEHLVDELILDIGKLGLGQTIRVRDIQVGEEIELLNNLSIPVASIEVPRALRSASAEDEEGEGEEGTEGGEGEKGGEEGDSSEKGEGAES